MGNLGAGIVDHEYDHSPSSPSIGLCKKTHHRSWLPFGIISTQSVF